MSPVRPSVCFVSWRAWPAIDPQAEGFVGGSESRAWLFARGLAVTGRFDVRFAIRHHRLIRERMREGVTIVPVLDRLRPMREEVSRYVEVTGGFPPLRLRRWTWPLLWQVPLLAVCRPFRQASVDPLYPHPLLQQVNADAWCTFGANAAALQVVVTAQSLGRPSILFLGADADLDCLSASAPGGTSPYGEPLELCRRALIEASAVIAQTEHQRQLLQERSGREAVVIENPIDLHIWGAPADPLCPTLAGLPQRFALWVGRADDFHKRPRLCLELARKCPQVVFVMVLNPREPAIEEEIRRVAPGNVTIVTRVPPDQLPSLMRRAVVFVSTSAAAQEGFPNVLLQAAACEVPIASLEAGADFIASAECGKVTHGDLDQLAVQVTRFWGSAADARRYGARGREYVTAHHGLKAQANQLAEVLQEVIAR